MKIGILGSGQLGRMLALAGLPLGATVSFYDKAPGTPTAGIGHTTLGAFDDIDSLSAFARQCDVVTYEFENVPANAARHIQNIRPVFPPPRALEVSQERVAEKTFFSSLGLPTPRFKGATSAAELKTAIDEVGVPCVVKTCTLGYDGKGQAKVNTPIDCDELWTRLGCVPLIVEEMVSFSRELSVIAVRNSRGEIVVYPLIENIHRDGILRRSEFPAPSVSIQLQQQAQHIVTAIAHELQYVGALAVELFEVNGALVINEMAPRVHNSGHITQDVAVTSQFENHMRAVMDLPLGDTSARCRGVMVNIIGRIPSAKEVLQYPQAKLHLYHKSEALGRKLGHINLIDPSTDTELTINSLL